MTRLMSILLMLYCSLVTASLPRAPILFHTPLTAIASNGAGHSVSNTIHVNLIVTNSPQYDANGNFTTDTRRIFTFDSENQLVSVVVSNNATNLTQSGFVFDGLHRRRIRTEAVRQAGTWVTNQIVRYIYDGNRVIQERDGSNNVVVTYTRGLDLSQSLEGAGGIGSLLARTHPGNHHFYHHSDGTGNVTAIMNEAQNLVAEYRYDPYSNHIAQRGALAEGNLYRFSSKEFHPASGLYYYGYRFYDPNLQRWLTKDPIGEKGGINLYRFVGNDPINRIDPFGLMDPIGEYGDQLAAQSFEDSVMDTVMGVTGHSIADRQRLTTSLDVVQTAVDFTGVGHVIRGMQDINEGNTARGAGKVALGTIILGTFASGEGAVAKCASTAKAAPVTLALVPKATISLGKWGEVRLAQVLGGAGVKLAMPFSTSLGPRYVDRLVNGIAYEAKAGLNVGLTPSIERQILKDAD